MLGHVQKHVVVYSFMIASEIQHANIFGGKGVISTTFQARVWPDAETGGSLPWMRSRC